MTALIFGNGKNKKTTTIFDLPGMVLDAHGNKIQSAKLHNVKHVKTAIFSLFSLTKQQKAVWHQHGDKKKIWITKGNATLVFDI